MHQRGPFIAAGIVLASAALLSAAIGMPASGIFVMAAAGIAAVIAVMAGRTDGDGRTMPRLPYADMVQSPPEAIHQHPGFASLFDALTFPLLLAEQGRISAANMSAKAVLGDFIVGADVRTAIRHPAASDLMGQAGAQRSAQAIDVVGIGKAGQRWSMQVLPLTEERLLIALEDLTSRDAIERMRADFVANASHELRTPLAVIIGTIETLLSPDAGGDAELRQRFLSTADKEARRMLRLVEDLLSISRIEASKGTIPQEPIDLYALCQSSVAELSASGDARASTIQISQSAPAVVIGDRAQLSQLTHNLLSNALKYGGTKGAVEVSIAVVGSTMVELAVTDHGEGIAAEHLPRLTERFYRIDSARSRSQGGTGLGLAIVKHIVNRHHGRLDIDSIVGTGTTVRVRLPRAPDSATATPI